MVYKLRTACWMDTVGILREVDADRVMIEHHEHNVLNGAEVTLENPRFGGEVMSLEKLRGLIRNRIQDSYVMTETLSTVDTYTGERTRTQEQT